MRRKLFLLAVAAAALASCSSDETLSVNQGLEDANTISFRPAIQGMTRTANGTGVKSAWETGDKLYVNAVRNVSGTTPTLYFQDEFVKDEVGFNSAARHFWPADLSTTKIYFTAFWGAPYTTISSGTVLNAEDANKENQFKLGSSYTVPDAVASQKDLLFANSATYDSKPSADGKVTLNFRHMLSQIVVKVANDQPNLNISITGVRVGYVAKTGSFTYSGSNTDTKETGANDATKIARSCWNVTAPTLATEYHTQNVTAGLNGTTPATDLTSFSSWILMPQQLTAATGYTTSVAPASASSTGEPDLTGAYLALKMSITESTVPIVAEQWCYWPIDTEWKPGYKYTYTINAGSGGYQPTDQNSDKTTLDPVLGGLVIWFSPTCTIDSWVDSEIVVSEPAVSVEEDVAKGSTKTYDVAAGTFGTYTINVTGLTADTYVILDPANDHNINATGATTATVVPASGKVTIRCSLTANSASAVTSTVYLKVYPSSGDATAGTNEYTSQKTTITINQAASGS